MLGSEALSLVAVKYGMVAVDRLRLGSTAYRSINALHFNICPVSSYFIYILFTRQYTAVTDGNYSHPRYES